MAKNLPILKLKSYPIRVAVWEHKNDRGHPYYSYRAQKSYKDAQGNWQETDFFTGADVLKVTALLRAAFEALEIQQDEKSGTPRDQQVSGKKADEETPF
jgi:hypothetical protein